MCIVACLWKVSRRCASSHRGRSATGRLADPLTVDPRGLAAACRGSSRHQEVGGSLSRDVLWDRCCSEAAFPLTSLHAKPGARALMSDLLSQPCNTRQSSSSKERSLCCGHSSQWHAQLSRWDCCHLHFEWVASGLHSCWHQAGYRTDHAALFWDASAMLPVARL